MQLMYAYILYLEMMMIYAKNYSAGELNRKRISELYRTNLLTRPSTKNVRQTIVAIGLGIIEVAGINPHTQVSINEKKFNQRRYLIYHVRTTIKRYLTHTQ
jgi:hypothetical protein